MQQYTKEELKEIRDKSYEMTSCHDDSMEQYKRDYAGITLREKIETILSMDSMIAGADGDFESAWKALYGSLMFDTGYYLRMCESLERSEPSGS